MIQNENKNLIKLALTSILMGGCICGVAYALITQPKSMGTQTQTVYTTNQTPRAEETKRTVEQQNPKLTTTTAGSGKKDRATEKSSKGYAKLVLITHLGYPTGSEVQSFVRYAYKISSENLDFVLTLDRENGKRDPYRRSFNKREDSWGFCQMSRLRHKDVVDTKEFREPYKQLDICRAKYKSGTRFYGYDVRMKSKNRFKID